MSDDSGRSVSESLPMQALLLDLDGTILDTARDLMTAVNRTLVEVDRQPVSEAQVRSWIGDGVRALVHSALDATGGHKEGMLEEAHERFMVHYGECFAEESAPYPGVLDVLERAREARVPSAVITNKAAAFTEPLLEATGLRPYLAVVVSGDTVANKKPDPEPVRHALKQTGAEAERSVLVGDSANDVNAGLAAGCQVVCVTYGYNRGADVYRLGADRVVEEFTAVWDFIKPEGSLAGSA
ncbi:phosphoglycolate phosphatase [Thiohalorhabdus sp.]|uniref:phosphoglycolate phosphatase n=1 Tax=Thiohalorhabdus sp. TaxID=3094134 RepID=UPI002FC38A4C